MKIHRNTIIATILSAVIAGIALAIPNNIHVSPLGSGTTCSIASPCSVSAGMTKAVSGDTLIFAVGDYPKVSITKSELNFEANGIVNVDGFYITGNNTTVTGFRIDDTPSYGMEIRSNNSVIKNNIVTKGRNSGIWVTGQNNLIENNDISKTIQPSPHSSGGDANCITFFGSGHIFRGNYCHDIYSDGVLVTDAHIDGFQTWDWVSVGGVGHDIVFEKNVMIFPNDGKIWNIEEGAYNITIKNNVAYAGLIALVVDGDNISFANNTFVGTGSGSDGLHLWRTEASLYNNIFAHQRQRVIENIDSSATITASNNCYLDYGAMLPANPGDVRGSSSYFVNEAQLNFHLQSNSPCIDKGITIATVADDKEGISRPQGSGYDMGAFEYLVGVPVITTPTNTFIPPTFTFTPTPTATFTAISPTAIPELCVKVTWTKLLNVRYAPSMYNTAYSVNISANAIVPVEAIFENSEGRWAQINNRMYFAMYLNANKRTYAIDMVCP